MKKGKRVISPEDRAIFWQSRNSGMGIRECARIAGISYQTALSWVKKAEVISTQIEQDKLMGDATGAGGGKQRINRANAVERDLPPVIPQGKLSERAQRGLEDFDYFRRVYLGRVPSPWQVDAAYRIVEML